ncbi:hypothetical protein E5S70_37815 [Ensifer adhaerens]|uniref:hypothetical protein n=1 Tax=Ensifer canadensis TaxID=555315 RepID=UPI00148F967D|nr:hypothetical protein [Ensifer canadensis]NOV21658.1 hypothetical protein [Ensifer canadensis]
MSKLNHGSSVLKSIDDAALQSRFSSASLNGTQLHLYTPERIKEIRWQFIVNCIRAEKKRTKLPGIPKALRRSIRCAKGMTETCVRAWLMKQPDYDDAKEFIAMGKKA